MPSNHLKLTMPTNILIRPSITEKSMVLAQAGQFTFFVEKSATKDSVKNVVESTFKVNVLKVRINNRPGKPKRSGKKRLLKNTPSRCLAIVTLKEGQSIDYFKLPDDGAKKIKKKTTKTPQKITPTKTPQRRGLLGLGKRKAQRTQDK